MNYSSNSYAHHLGVSASKQEIFSEREFPINAQCEGRDNMKSANHQLPVNE